MKSHSLEKAIDKFLKHLYNEANTKKVKQPRTIQVEQLPIGYDDKKYEPNRGLTKGRIYDHKKKESH